MAILLDSQYDDRLLYDDGAQRYPYEPVSPPPDYTIDPTVDTNPLPTPDDPTIDTNPLSTPIDPTAEVIGGGEGGDYIDPYPTLGTDGSTGEQIYPDGTTITPIVGGTGSLPTTTTTDPIVGMDDPNPDVVVDGGTTTDTGNTPSTDPVYAPSLDELYPVAPTAEAPATPTIADPTGATLTTVDSSGTNVATEDAAAGQIGDVSGAGVTETDQTVGEVATPGTATAETDRLSGVLDEGAAGMEAAQAESTPEQLVDEELARILGQDSPLLARAREEAMRIMNARGLTNTSMAAGATFGAMVDRALPMAQQNAAQAFQRMQQNTAFLQQAGIFNAEQANQLLALEAQLGTQVNIFNAEQLNQASQLTAQLQTAMEQQDAEAYNRAALQLAELQYSALVEQARLDQQTNLFNAEQQNAANALMAELETAIAQQDAQAANQISMQLADLRRQAQAQQGEIDFAAEQQRAMEQQRYNEQVIDAVTRLNQQYLQGTQAMDLAALQSQYQLLIQTNETAGNVFNNYMNAMGNIMANPQMSTAQIADAVDNLARMVEGSLSMIAEINGMDFGDVESIVPYGSTGGTYVPNPYYPNPYPDNPYPDIVYDPNVDLWHDPFIGTPWEVPPE